MFHPKTAAAGIGGALAVIIVWVLSLFSIDVPPEVAAALTTILSFGASYLIPR